MHRQGEQQEMQNWKKNQLVTIQITDIAKGGEGIGHLDSFVVFVKDTVPGDLAEVRLTKVKKHYAYGRLMKLLQASSLRQETPCPIARSCGGCQLQMLSYDAQLRWKEEMVRNNLMRIGGIADPPLRPIVGMAYPWRYRNKAQYPVGTGTDGLPVAGYYAGRTHSIIPCADCFLCPDDYPQIQDIVLAWMTENGIRAYDQETGTGLIRHILIRKGFATGEILVCLVINGRHIPAADRLCTALASVRGLIGVAVNRNTEKTNVILGKETETIWGRPVLTDRIGGISYQISAVSFFQVNPVQTEKLYEKALAYAGLTGRETVMDLYCGTGSISLFLAQKAARVYGVEIVEQAVRDAAENAALNGITNVSFYAGKAEEVVPELYEQKQIRADVVVVDPPRKGCDAKLIRTMIDMQPQRIVYVSCDPATLARDVCILGENGYVLREATPFDLFPHTVHCETVALLSLQSGKTTVQN